MATKKRIKEKSKPYTLRFNPIYRDKLKQCVKLLEKNDIKSPEGYKINNSDLINNIFHDYFKDKILTNTYLDLSKGYFFRMDLLLKNETTEATPLKPITDPKNIFLIKRIPNNLDVFNKENITYCFNDNIYKHKGLYVYKFYDPEENKETILNLMFEYDFKEEKIIIQLIKEPSYYIDPEVYEDLKKDSNYNLDTQIYNDLENKLLNTNINIMIPYKTYRDLELALNNYLKSPDFNKDVKRHIDRPLYQYYKLMNGF